LDDTASPSEINIADGNATLITNVEGTGTLDKTGSGNLYIGASSLLSVGGFEVVAGQTTINVGGQLTASNGGGPGDDGHITVWSGAILDNEGGSITCASLNLLGTVQNASGTLTVAGGVTNQGTLRLLGNAQLTFDGALINNGVLDIMTWSGVLPPGLVNNGVLLDGSAIQIESCAVKNGNVDLTIMGYAGHTYQLQASSALNPATWSNVASPQAGAGETLEFTDDAGAGYEFYRVAVY
jgi:hypothetical protein